MIITEILRLKEMKFTLREIGEAANCSKTTAGEIFSVVKTVVLPTMKQLNFRPKEFTNLFTRIFWVANR